ncbi:hypothetical protein FA09DRAFT_338489 [Tilletiopsis washingtonensis]|uniref:Uncharacterized protein n=1 Tax=Tilletiopsis washingtonensis TaxID=58919 RepID=A0A316ZAK5_9BASI|nr:hypothetical protein FA09DRAFT_338489 [Tilletiopsis washingtonensis]PWN98054.1 hypothetical protein FA09DRAFT_338489 [Tilletiopsis washingtonensis]
MPVAEPAAASPHEPAPAAPVPAAAARTPPPALAGTAHSALQRVVAHVAHGLLARQRAAPGAVPPPPLHALAQQAGIYVAALDGLRLWIDEAQPLLLAELARAQVREQAEALAAAQAAQAELQRLEEEARVKREAEAAEAARLAREQAEREAEEARRADEMQLDTPPLPEETAEAPAAGTDVVALDSDDDDDKPLAAAGAGPSAPAEPAAAIDLTYSPAATPSAPASSDAPAAPPAPAGAASWNLQDPASLLASLTGIAAAPGLASSAPGDAPPAAAQPDWSQFDLSSIGDLSAFGGGPQTGEDVSMDMGQNLGGLGDFDFDFGEFGRHFGAGDGDGDGYGGQNA